MSARLQPHLPLGPEESPPSYASRLARFHGAASGREFCRDVGLTFQGLADGCPEMLERLADLAGVPLEPLNDAAIRRQGTGFTLRGQELVRSTLRRRRLYGCPACLAADLDGSVLRAGAAMVGRTRWLLDPIRSCPEHGLALAEFASAVSAHHFHDFALLIEPNAGLVRHLSETRDERAASGLEVYLLRRLEGVVGEAPWLDRLPWHAAARTCEMVGAVAAFGRTPNLDRFTDADWHRAGVAGYEVARDGEAGLRAFLADLQRSYPASSLGKEGAQATFGRFYQWLANKALHPTYEPVRDLVFKHVHKTTPVGPESEMFGRPFPSRILHSVRTAALETGAHPKRLRKILAAAGHIGAGHDDRLDHHVLFDAAAVAGTLHLAAGTISMVQAADYLNAGRVQTKLLVDAGHIRPAVAADGDPRGFGKHGFAKADLDEFLARLSRQAVPVSEAAWPRFSIPRAAKFAHCGAMEIVALIDEGSLDWVGVLNGVRGYLALLVDGEEIKRRVQAPALPGLTPGRVIKVLGTTYDVVKALTTSGVLPVQRMVNPLTRQPVEIVLDADLAEFRSTFTSVVELARDRGVHPFNLKAELTRAGVMPALDPARFKATFYRRADVA